MSAPQSTGFSLKRATAVSVALHFVAAALLAFAPHATSRPAGDGRGIAQEAVRVSTVTIAFEHAAVAAKTAPRVRRAPHVATTFVRTARAVAIAPPATERSPVVAAKPVAGVAAPRALPASVVVASTATRADTGRTRGEAARLPVATERPTETVATQATAAAPALAVPVVEPPATASPAAVALVAARSRTLEAASDGGWGQSAKPLVEDDAEFAKLRASAHVSGKISIEVDENGNATRVTLPSSLTGDVRADLERQFLALRYLPAECNGLRCTGTLQLTL